jgi:hypothetical protein
MPEIPAPAHVLHSLAALWPPLYTALEWATQQTRAYFDAEGIPIDRHLAPSLVRYQAKRHLPGWATTCRRRRARPTPSRRCPITACPWPTAGTTSMCCAF